MAYDSELENILESIDQNGPAPEQEPMRQYYFIKKCRDYVKEKSEELGRPLTASTVTFGCQMNARDSEKLTGILEEIGYTMVQDEDADFVIYNTCTVRDNANQKVYGRLGFLHSLKKKNPHMVIALCGCMMQEPTVVEKLKKSYRFVNLIFGTHNIYKFAELLYSCYDTDRMVIDIWKDTDQIVEDLPAERKYFFKSGVNIMFGCNNFCSYCIVPYVRGRERSREPKDIIREIENLAADGVVEVMLLGQNVNSYGKNLEHPVSFAELLREVAKIEGIERIRFMTSHPKDLSDELIDVMAQSKKVCHHLHLPMQSGSSRILKIMNRRYTKEQYLNLVEKLRAAVPDISLTTDIIVGFPGETEEEFAESKAFLEKIQFYETHIFKYSRRKGTRAAVMENQVSDEKKAERGNILLELNRKNQAAYEEERIGDRDEVLFEELMILDGEKYYAGHTREYIRLAIPAAEDYANQIVPVRIQGERKQGILTSVRF